MEKKIRLFSDADCGTYHVFQVRMTKTGIRYTLLRNINLLLNFGIAVAKKEGLLYNKIL